MVFPQLDFASDIGKVISNRSTDGTAPDGGNGEVAHAFDVLAEINARLEGRTGVISKCHRRMELWTRDWLSEQRFYARTGIDPAHVFFVPEVADKAPLATRLGLRSFVDDRIDILESMTTVSRRFWFQPKPATLATRRDTLPSEITPVNGWLEIWAELESI